MTKILIAGGTGFIGYHLAKKCLLQQWSVYSLSSKKPKKTRRHKNVKYILADVRNRNKLKNLKKINFDFVVNLSGEVNHKIKKKLLIHIF